MGQPGTHNSRREDSEKVATRGTGECPGESEQRCSVLRTLRAEGKKGESIGARFSEAYLPLANVGYLSEAATMLIPGHAGFGAVVGGGAISSVLKAWQTAPPGSGESFLKIEAANEAEEDKESLAISWIFWGRRRHRPAHQGIAPGRHGTGRSHLLRL